MIVPFHSFQLKFPDGIRNNSIWRQFRFQVAYKYNYEENNSIFETRLDSRRKYNE